MNAETGGYHKEVTIVQAADGEACGGTRVSPFDRPEWFALLAESRPGAFTASAPQDDATVSMPLNRTDGRIEALRNWYSFTWRPLVPHGATGETALQRLAKDLKRETPRVTLWPLPEEDGSAKRLAHAFRKAGWSVALTQCDENHVLPVEGRSFAEYWAGRPGRLRTTLKRKARKVEVEIVEHFDANLWQYYENIYSESWKPREDEPDLLRRFAQAEGAAGRIRFGIARADGRPVAAQFWTVENGIAYIHKLAHLESAKPVSPGTTLSAALFEHVIDRDGVELVDFGTGSDAYKRDWMEEVRPRYMLDALDPRQPAAWIPLAKRTVRAILASTQARR
ncbi:GNAT family N-acetyltransferase [Citromicrobium bathyomarinum]|uniref:GNAT family N-acetyltransferase n=1 Tax=Sphingomonadales TaxID=204457 RepID=UPI000C565E2D|nr:GNAT family N-acetyltransferase [Citromicrobium sp.]MBO80100.1 GNAT family N-acetyltransferase [Citromicrobium sp.]